MILLLRRWGYELTEARLRITDPAMQIREWRQKVVHLKDKLHHVQDKILTAYKNDYERFKIKLTLLSPQNILERGYLIGKRKNGDVVTRAKDLKVDDLLDIVFYDGVAEVQVAKRNQTKETKT
jgi:exodeoxyribonuclease VII large subunit